MNQDALALDSISRTVSAVLLRHPFLAHVIMNMRREVTDEVPVAAVTVRGGQLRLLVNAESWLNELGSDRHRCGVLLHEALHVVLAHLLRHRAFPDKLRFNVAADLAVNSLIPAGDLPPEAITTDMRFPFVYENRLFHLPPEDRIPGKTLEWYYDRIRTGPPGARQVNEGDEEGQEGELQPGRGLRGGGCEYWGDEEGAGAGRDASAVVQSAVQSALRSLGPVGAKRLPPELRKALEECGITGEPAVDWRRLLRCFAGRSRNTRLATTLKRPSKRFGTVPGVRVRQKSHVVVAVDTSGSISDDQLQQFFEQVHLIWRTGAVVTILGADDDVRSVEKYRGARVQPLGGGGTDFDPVIAWVNARAHAIDSLVYLTDAEGSRSLRCRRRLMWIIHSSGGRGDRPSCATPGELVAWMGD